MTALRCLYRTAPAVLLICSWAHGSAAQDLSQGQPPHTDEIIVPANSAANSSGRLAVNIASGTNNQQIGDAAVTAGELAITFQSVSQRLIGSAPVDRATSIIVEDGAFAGTQGLSSINITAGTQNQMANLAALAVGINGALSDQLLEQSRASIEPNGGNLPGSLSSNDQIAIGETAFGDGSGLLQVNLIGGEGNSSANTFALTIVSEGSP